MPDPDDPDDAYDYDHGPEPDEPYWRSNPKSHADWVDAMVQEREDRRRWRDDR